MKYPLCIFALDTGSDGSVWVQSTDAKIAPWRLESDTDAPGPIELYVIIPEAVAE